MTKEILLVSAGDQVWSGGGTLPEFARPDRYLGPLPANLVERPDERTELTYKGQPFRAATRIDDCHGILQAVYSVHGSKGVEVFFKENDFVPRVHVGGRVVVKLDPEQFLSGPRLDLYRLFREAARALGVWRNKVLTEVVPLAQALGKKRLTASRKEVESQVLRYYRSIGGERGAVGILDSDFMPWGDLLDETGTQVKSLRAELRALAPFIRRAEDAQNAWRAQRGRRYAQIVQERPWWVGVGPVETSDLRDLRLHEEAERALRERFPEVAQLEALAKEQREALVQELSAAASVHPVLWRLYTMSPDAATGELGRTILRELRTTWQSSRELEADLSGDADLVWRLGPLIRGALSDAGVELYSVAWTACEERMEEETGMRTAAIVSMSAGLAQLGMAGLALLAGGPLAPPIGVALFAVEAISSLADAVQEYLAYRLQSAAFRACLDPGQALAVEPSLLSAVLTIGFDLLSLIPPARGGRAVP